MQRERVKKGLEIKTSGTPSLKKLKREEGGLWLPPLYSNERNEFVSFFSFTEKIIEVEHIDLSRRSSRRRKLSELPSSAMIRYALPGEKKVYSDNYKLREMPNGLYAFI